MKLALLLALGLALAGAVFAAPAVSAKPDPPQCLVAPCCAQGDLGCRIDWLRDELCRQLC